VNKTPKYLHKTVKTQFASLQSPYESMKRKLHSDADEPDQTTVLEDDEDEDDSTVLFAQRTARLPDMSMTPRGLREELNRDPSPQKHKDPLLHRMLDKNYRLQATPHKPALRISPIKGKETEKRKEAAAWQDSPMSSPEMAVPTLRSEAFMSPYKSNARQRLAAATQGPRTPGISVQTPNTGKKTRDVFAEDEDSTISGTRQRYEIDYESDEGEDDDIYAGMSPPKTIQFALPPSKLLQTPAREASRRIVDDILLDAGADPDSSEYSPTMVKMNENILDDSF
jgi:DASH complex subunit ASK1